MKIALEAEGMPTFLQFIEPSYDTIPGEIASKFDQQSSSCSQFSLKVESRGETSPKSNHL